MISTRPPVDFSPGATAMFEETQQKRPWYRSRMVLMTAPILVVLLGIVGAYLLFAPPGAGNAGTEEHYAALERHRAAQQQGQTAPPADPAAATAADPQASPAADPAAQAAAETAQGGAQPADAATQAAAQAAPAAGQTAAAPA